MKKFIVLMVTLWLSMLISKSMAQPNLLGQTSSYIKGQTYLPRSVGWFEYSQVLNDSTTYIQLVDREDKNVHFRYYFNKHDTCTYYIILQPLSNLAIWVETLNEKYIKTKDNQWVSKSNDMLITLTTYPKDNNFVTDFSKL